MIVSLELIDESKSVDLATRLAPLLQAPLLVTFSGEIGAGKTTFIRAVLRALGVKSAIKSPTFSLVESYQCKDLQIHHFDLYRIHDETELEYIGFRDYFNQDSICFIEWPEQAASSIESKDLHFAFTMLQGGGRLLTINAVSNVGQFILTGLIGK